MWCTFEVAGGDISSLSSNDYFTNHSGQVVLFGDLVLVQDIGNSKCVSF